MLTYITGLPGSGKTYKALLTLFSNFGKDKDIVKGKRFLIKDVTYALTNINELNYDKFENVSSFKWNDLYKNISVLYDMQVVNSCSDSELIEKSKELKLYDVLIIIDECHNFFDKSDKILIWWIAYHRHMHHTLILITQNLGLVNYKYKKFAESFLKAVPSSLKLFNNSMKYHEYVDSRMGKANKVGVVNAPIYTEVFATYGSGQNVKQKSVLIRFLISSLAALIFIIFIIFLFKEKYTSSIQEDENINTNQNDNEVFISSKSITVPENQRVIYNSDNNHVVILTCSNQKNLCTYNNKSFNKTLIDSMAKKFNYEVLDVSKFKNSSFSKYYILVDDVFYYMFNEKEKEKEDRPTSVLGADKFFNKGVEK